ncbi:hypothetical protein Pmar_PMAR017208 [Perkinsus marinus ATCC 50983]|uniref:Uncharacterized protein n=1 Tax=Perkinsus marinus (strain ATCC 50983 / TXsc) TaxID=423536 RepID=C5LZZ7_PERM5|nr:hypothetical protein Pmar_PMAR017208 [Perkinsus marinus ATCC 50983]EEQ97695.1 hypothetical protein Pmar_PMAR017208 [Perkinsus marinus ATCC 50983]|eukprot:XP_002764978.1 hypothetical protein Pmar_PMAR017208 [Perkinsus marinus ATCC 50983]
MPSKTAGSSPGRIWRLSCSNPGKTGKTENDLKTALAYQLRFGIRSAHHHGYKIFPASEHKEGKLATGNWYLAFGAFLEDLGGQRGDP